MAMDTTENTLTAEMVGMDDIERARQGLRSDRDWLAWLLAFAQTPLDEQPSEAIKEAQVRFLTFLLTARGPGLGSHGRWPPGPTEDDKPRYSLPSREEISAIHERLRTAIEHILAGQPHDFGHYAVRTRLVTFDGVPWVIEEPEDAITTRSYPDQVQWTFGRLLTHLSREWNAHEHKHPLPYIRECPGPVPRQPGICGRWFVGRGDQRYCSPVCQNRGATRAARARQAETRPKRPRGRPRKSLSPIST
jgi:hypothetical protein